MAETDIDSLDEAAAAAELARLAEPPSGGTRPGTGRAKPQQMSDLSASAAGQCRPQDSPS